MGHVVSRQPWGVIDIDTTAGRVFFQQEWFYTWTLFNASVSPWTPQQRRFFHNTLDRQIWALWSNRVRLRVSGVHSFARRFGARGVPINFDIRWMRRPAQWAVRVRKMPAGSNPTTFISFVDFGARRVELDTGDLTAYHPANEAGNASTNPNFLAGPHEFGHTLQAGDEYNAASRAARRIDLSSVATTIESITRVGRALNLLADTESIMNVGRQIRPRHLRLVVSTLNTMIPGVVWSAPATIP